MERAEWESVVREQERRAGRCSPFYMTKYIMGRSWMKNGQTWGWGAEHAELGRQVWGLHLTRAERPAGTILKIEWCRDSRKSTFTAGYMVTALLHDPDERILLDSDTQPNAIKKLAPVKGAFEDEYFQELFGDLRSEPWTKDAIQIKRRVTASDASVTATGSETSKTSQHYTMAVPDDKQTKENSQTKDALDKVARDFDSYESLTVQKMNDAGLVEGPMIVAPGTVWGENDLFAKIDRLAAEDDKAGRPRRVYNSRKGAYVKFRDAKGEEVDDLTRPQFPTTLTQAMINTKRASMTDQDFAHQYLLKRISPEKQMFHRDMFIEHSLTRTQLDGMHVYILVDPAGLAVNPDGKKEGYSRSDDNVVAAVAVDDLANLYVLEYEAERMDRDKLLETIKRMWAEYDGPWLKGASVEKGFRQTELAAWLKKEAAEPDRDTKRPVHIKWLDAPQLHQKKDLRISALQPYAKNRKIRIRAGMTKLVEQFTKYPSPGIHDDVPDAVAMTLDVMTVPGHKTEEQKWGSAEWRAAEIKAGADPHSLPTAEHVRTWKTIMKEKGRRAKLKKLKPGMPGYVTI